MKEAAATQSQVTCAGTVEECETKDDYTYCILRDAYLIDQKISYLQISMKQLKKNPGRKVMKVRLTFKDARHYAAGVFLVVRGDPTFAARATNKGQFDQASYDRLLKIGFRIKSPAILYAGGKEDPMREGMLVLRSGLRKRIADTYPKDQAGVVSCMLLGDKSLLEEDTRSLWQLGGVSHMLAISGLHLTVLGMGLYRMLRKMKVKNGLAAGTSMAVLFAYTLFTGLSVSTVRAFFMFVLLMAGRLLGRTYDPPTACAIAALLILLENPYYLCQPSFDLSFAAVVIVNLFAHRSSFTLSYMLYLGMLPIILFTFFEIPIYSIPLNFLVVPLLPFMLGLSMVGTFFGGAFAWPSKMLLAAVTWLLKSVRELPFSSVILGRPTILQVVIFYAMLAFFACLMKRDRLLKKRFRYFALVPLMILVLGIHPHTGLTMTALDVGQGDSICVELPGGRSVLVDSGSSTVMNVGQYRVLPFLKAEGIRRLDYMVATHMDSDHISGLEEILTMISKKETSLRVGTLLLPRLKEKGQAYLKMESLARAAGVRILYVSDGDFFLLPGVRIDVLNPADQDEHVPVDENADCVVLSLTYKKFDALLTGDVENEGEDHLYARLRKRGRTYEVLKVAHHGSRNSTPIALLKVIRPKVSIISSGKGNRYGHPNKELLDRLTAMRTDIVRTDTSGAITVTTDGIFFRVASMGT
ncbi:MAG: DNA internalization-related competence protein ComEC/Rec2 [Lachnospiraceae bacterium]|nr:DNA internalization-related competence protein ComEC/Rec2 [Lachnospiraceae bacterium]